MSFTDALGLLFSLQKPLLLPYNATIGTKNPSKSKIVNVLLKILYWIPLTLFLSIFVTEISLTNFYFDFTIPLFRGDESYIINIVLFIGALSPRIAVILMMCTNLKNRQTFLQLLKEIEMLENRLKPFSFKRKIKFFSKSNIQALLIIILICVLCFPSLINWMGNNYNTKVLIFEINGINVAFATYLMVFYYINFFSEITKIISFIILLNKTDRTFQVLKRISIAKDFIRIIPLMNCVLGQSILLHIIQYIFFCAMILYYYCWLLVDNDLREHISVALTWAAFSVSIFLMIFLIYRGGNKLERKIQQLLDGHRYILCSFEDANQPKSFKFNKEQFQLWRFHIETRLLAGTSVAINYKGYYKVLSFIVIYFVVVVQFKQMTIN
uniref:Gustatory receptor n=1 Tax=Lutzomyia longipalpis TaxID=7200 RepID=A0A3F2ZD65_LUTLO